MDDDDNESLDVECPECHAEMEFNGFDYVCPNCNFNEDDVDALDFDDYDENDEDNEEEMIKDREESDDELEKKENNYFNIGKRKKEKLMENEKLFDGYDKVKWGFSLDEVKRLYNNLKDTTLTENKDENIQFGIKCLSQTFPKDELMNKRSFFFYKDKLFKVVIVFNVKNRVTEDVLIEKFVNKYGYLDKIDKIKYEDYPGSDECSFCVYGVRFYSSKLTICITSIIDMNQSTNEIFKHENIYTYVDPIAGNKIEIEKRKKDIENIEL